MNEIRYMFAKIAYRMRGRNQEVISNYFRKSGMKIGEGCNICCNIMTTEPYLINIGENVTISSEVIFVTHDNSINKIDENKPNLFGFIRIGGNCFLGERSTIMYGVTLANDIIVASGSVVTKSFERERIIIGGNPAKIIGTWDDLLKQKGSRALGRIEIRSKYKSNPELMIQRKVIE